MCPDFGIVYNGTAINKDAGGINMDTWQACSSKCDSNTHCTHWSWVRVQYGKPQGSCFLKKGKGKANTVISAVSGKRNCYSGPIPSMYANSLSNNYLRL